MKVSATTQKMTINNSTIPAFLCGAIGFQYPIRRTRVNISKRLSKRGKSFRYCLPEMKSDIDTHL